MSDPRKPSGISSSSVNILKSLPNTNIATSVEEKGELIYIPQKCYGIITPNTPQSIKGFFTTGLNMCSGIVAIAHNRNDNSIYFCHADTGTNLLDNTHGLLGWISKLPISVTSIKLVYDDVQYQHFKGMISQLNNLVKANDIERHITTHANQGNSTDMLVLRNGEIKYGGGVYFDYEDKGYTINSESKIEDKINLLVEHMDNVHSPICVFDGDHLLSLDEIFTTQPWVKNAIEDAAVVESYAEDIRELDRTRDELFPESEESKVQNISPTPKSI